MFTEQFYYTMILYHIINIKVAAFNINLRESNIIATSVTQNALKTKKQVHKSIVWSMRVIQMVYHGCQIWKEI